MTTAVMPDTGNVAGELALDRLAPDHWPNPRGPVDTTSPAFAELKASIAEQGILEPIVIGPPLLELDGCHAIIAGWRRFTAARELGLPSVPVHQKIAITDARAALRAALAENLARESMTPLAEASAIARLIELGDTQVQAAAAVGVSERTARERLRLLDLPKVVKDAIDAGHVPTTCTRQLQLIADVSPAAAAAIAKKMEKGTVRAHELLEPKRLDEVLSRLDAKAGLVKLTSWTALKGLGLPAATYDALKARNAKAAGYGDGASIDISPRIVGKELLDAAAADGKLIRCVAQHGGEVVYLAGADWHEKLATIAVEHVEETAAARAALRETVGAVPVTPAAAGEDPETRRRDAQRARAEAIDVRATPHATHMNAELGRRLRGLDSCPIKGGVARVLIELGLAPDCVGVEFAIEGYPLVDPESPWATYGSAYDGGAYDAWEAMIREASTPEHAAAEIVKPTIACLFADPRADGQGDRRAGCPAFWRELELAARQAAIELRVLPPRALALDAARIELAEAESQHGRQLARRRILFELDKVDKGRLDRGELATRAGAWGRDAGELVGIGMQVTGRDFDQALRDLAEAGHVKTIEKTDVVQVTITAGGRKSLKALPALPPIIADIDAGSSPPPEQPDDTEPQDDDDVGNGVRRRSQVLAMITATPGSTIPELAERMGIKQHYFYRLLPGLADDGLIRKDGRGWHPAVTVHVTPVGGGEPVEAELQPGDAKGAGKLRKVIYTASRTAAWVAPARITDLPAEASS